MDDALIFTDLLSPDQSLEDDIMPNIPIRSWSRGSPVADQGDAISGKITRNDQKSRESTVPATNDGFNGLFNYDKLDPILKDVDNSNNSFEAFLENAKDDEIMLMNSIGDNFLNDDLQDAIENLDNMSPHMKQFIASKTSEPGEIMNIMNEYNDLINYLESPRVNNNHNNNNIQIQKKQKEKNVTKNNNKVKVSKAQQANNISGLKANSDDNTHAKAGKENILVNKSDSSDDVNVAHRNHRNIDDESIQKISRNVSNDDQMMLPKKKKNKKNNNINNNNKKKIESYYADLNNKQFKPTPHHLTAETKEKHKIYLAELAEKRRIEDEELLQQELRMQAKRKKFKEALLEKALRARKMPSSDQEDIIDNNNNNNDMIHRKESTNHKNPPSNSNANAAKPPSIIKKQSMTKVKHIETIIKTDEDLIRQEEEKREYIAGIRRKFKEQHKKILLTLLEKQKENEKKNQLELEKEQERKERYRQKYLKMLAAKEQQNQENVIQQNQQSDSDDSNQSSKKVKQDNKSKRKSLNDGTSHNRVETKSASHIAAGSALEAIRRTSQSVQENRNKSNIIDDDNDDTSTIINNNNNNVIQNQNVENGSDFVENDLMNERDKKMKKLASKIQQVRVIAYLAALAEQKKKEEQLKKKSEDKKRKMIEKISKRLMQEAMERKLMLSQDKLKYQQAALAEKVNVESNNNNNLNENVVKVKKQVSVKKRDPVISTESVPLTEKSKPVASNCSNNVSVKRRGSFENSNNIDDKQVKVSPDAIEAITNRLYNRGSSKSNNNENNDNIVNVPIRDFNDWKRKNAVPSDAKVFAMTGWYPCVKQALLDRGWYFNSDSNSPYFNMKWTLRSLDVSQENLQPWQLTNHYLKNVAITTKVGLIKSLQSLVWLADVDIKDIIPRAYDLSLPDEMQAFLDDFRFQHAENMLKKLYTKLTGYEQPLVTLVDEKNKIPGVKDSADNNDNNDNEGSSELPLQSYEEMIEKLFSLPPLPPLSAGCNLNEILINRTIFDTCCIVLEKQIKPYEDSYVDDLDYSSNKLITDLEWELLSNYNLFSSIRSLPFDAPEPVDGFLKQQMEDNNNGNNNSLTQMQLQQIAKEKRRKLKQENDLREEVSNSLSELQALTQQDFDRIHYILSKLMYLGKYQATINGNGSDSSNMWIVKPAAKSRGRGIQTFMDINKLLKYIEAGSSLSNQWMVQKYIENPLIIAKRKFDLRQWVLVTDWNPLTIYFYDEFYARFSVDEYSNSINDLDNQYIHLVNNSIGKNSENFTKKIIAENDEEIDGYMWSFDSFRRYVSFIHSKRKEGAAGKEEEDLVLTKIQPRMKDIAKWSLMCASEMIEHRKNSWELYGFDYMVDDNLNTWLIEINSSPACDYSTPVTSRYVQKALVELLSVVIDVREWEAVPKKQRGVRPSTDGWENIYVGNLLEIPVGSFGIDISLKGEGYKRKNNIYNNNMMGQTGSSKNNNDSIGISMSGNAYLSGMKNKPMVSVNVNTSNAVTSKGGHNLGKTSGDTSLNSTRLLHVIPKNKSSRRSNSMDMSDDDNDDDMKEFLAAKPPVLGMNGSVLPVTSGAVAPPVPHVPSAAGIPHLEPIKEMRTLEMKMEQNEDFDDSDHDNDDVKNDHSNRAPRPPQAQHDIKGASATYEPTNRSLRDRGSSKSNASNSNNSNNNAGKAPIKMKVFAPDF
eukprot:gene12342-16553_t